MKKNRIQIVTMAFGAVLALAVLCSHLFQAQFSNEHAAKIEKSETSGEKKAGDAIILAAPTLTPPSSFLVQLNLEIYCLFEVITETKVEETVESTISLAPQRLLLTLFRVIIAPNAP